MRRFKHWFRHEWIKDPFQLPFFYRQPSEVEDHVCMYPGCKARSLFSTQTNIRFGIFND